MDMLIDHMGISIIKQKSNWFGSTATFEPFNEISIGGRKGVGGGGREDWEWEVLLIMFDGKVPQPFNNV
jgi:hypothetical protein